MEITCNWLAEPRAKMRRLFEKFYGACKQQKFYTRYLNDTIKSIIRYLHWPHIGEYFFLCIRNIKTRSLISDKGIVSVQCSRFLCSLYIQLIKKKLSSKTLNDELCAYKGCLLTSFGATNQMRVLYIATMPKRIINTRKCGVSHLAS